MSLRIRRLQIAMGTEAGPFGVDLKFEDGLNVLSAPNTSGKSTCVMSILYALGLEGMLGSSPNPPLPDAMTRRLTHDNREVNVLESRVRLEVENHRKEFLTIERLVTGTPQERQLIRCTLGPALSEKEADFKRKDFYVRTKGGMQAESGFHRHLAEFVGYKLPMVPGAEMEPVPLYLECLFPYFFVDQITGWRDIKSRMPTYLRIPEMQKRSGEFILDLDVLRRAAEKQELLLRRQQLEMGWKKIVQQAKAELPRYQAALRGAPEEPTVVWPPTPPPQLFVTDGTDWMLARTASAKLRERLDKLVTEDIPKAEEASQSLIGQLRESEESLNIFGSRLEISTKDLMSERAHRESVWKRLGALTEDYRKYQDAKRLQDRGGLVSLQSTNGVCPTCHQDLKDTLLPQATAASPMTLEENMEFIRDQIGTFKEMLNDADDVIEARESDVEAILNRIKELNAQIRALKKTLKSDGRMPSVAAVQERLHTEARLQVVQMAEKKYEDILEILKGLAKEWGELQGRLKTIADVALSADDERKLKLLETSFVSQLKEYGFSSFPIQDIGIGRESYRPSREGYDIGLTSASDTIRMIWAYLLGMLEVARREKTNHLGFVVFDEPRQQGAQAPSFDALLRRAEESGNVGQQVIFTTSDEKSLLDKILLDLDCNHIPFKGKVLLPLRLAPPGELAEEPGNETSFDDEGNDEQNHEIDF